MSGVRRMDKNIKKKRYNSVILKRKASRYREMFLKTRELSNEIAKKAAKIVDDRFKKIILDVENSIKEQIPPQKMDAALDYSGTLFFKNGINGTFPILDDDSQEIKLDSTEYEVCDKIVNKAVEEIEDILYHIDYAIKAVSEERCPMKKAGVAVTRRILEEELLLTCFIVCKF